MTSPSAMQPFSPSVRYPLKKSELASLGYRPNYVLHRETGIALPVFQGENLTCPQCEFESCDTVFVVVGRETLYFGRRLIALFFQGVLKVSFLALPV